MLTRLEEWAMMVTQINAPHSALSYQHVFDAFHPLRWLRHRSIRLYERLWLVVHRTGTNPARRSIEECLVGAVTKKFFMPNFRVKT